MTWNREVREHFCIIHTGFIDQEFDYFGFFMAPRFSAPCRWSSK